MTTIPILGSGRKNLESVNKVFMFGILNKTKNYLKDTGTVGKVFKLYLIALGGLFLILCVICASTWMIPSSIFYGSNHELLKSISIWSFGGALYTFVYVVIPTVILCLIGYGINAAIEAIKDARDWTSFRYSDDHTPQLKELKAKHRKPY